MNNFKIKRGAKREDGMIFWHYRANGSEYWISIEKFKDLQNSMRISSKKYADNNRDKKRQSCRNWLKNNKEYDLLRGRKRYALNPEKMINYSKEWKIKNYHKYKLSKYLYHAKKMKTDPIYKLKHSIKNLVRICIKNGGFGKKTKVYHILGCSYDDFKKHIECQFIDKMSWENHGKWHFDHIIPISFAKTEEDIIKLNHYTNFQPLWAIDNIKKSNKLEYGY